MIMYFLLQLLSYLMINFQTNFLTLIIQKTQLSLFSLSFSLFNLRKTLFAIMLVSSHQSDLISLDFCVPKGWAPSLQALLTA